MHFKKKKKQNIKHFYCLLYSPGNCEKELLAHIVNGNRVYKGHLPGFLKQNSPVTQI